VLDGTLGGGGHTEALLENGAIVVALDQDPQAIAAATERLGSWIDQGRLRVIKGNFGEIDRIPELADERFDAILLDLGISSHQIDDADRGFTFRPGARLDMRMSDQGRDAAALLNELPEHELQTLFSEYADEPKARRLAREVAHRRESRPFETSDDLVGAIRGALGARSGPADFARIFQGVRIAVNDEMEMLDRALPALRERLVPGGVMAVIAYHSGEDRRVKHLFREWSTACVCPPRQPVCTCDGVAAGTLPVRKAIVPDEEEIARNPRSRSARLRLWKRAL
jgi:16S rRNA (cytosine1402-N4)-methyltransferase